MRLGKGLMEDARMRWCTQRIRTPRGSQQDGESVA